MELILNGEIHESLDGNGRKEVSFVEELKPEQSSWIAIRAFQASDKTVVFGHTSPVWLQVDGKPVGFTRDARYLLGIVDELIRYTNEKANFETASRKEETLNLYEKARTVYAKIAKEPR